MWSNFTGFISSGANLMFLLFAICTISGAMVMITSTRIVNMVVALAFTFLSMAGLYVLLNAEFVAFVQVLIYAGAVSILMIFGIMMTKHTNDDEEPKRPWHNGLLTVGVVLLFGILFYAIQNASFPVPPEANPSTDNTFEIGKLLFNVHVIPFELMSVLLTVAFIGAIVIAKREED